MSELKVAQVAFPFLPTQGGREIFIKRLSGGLAQNGIPVTIFADSAARSAIGDQEKFSLVPLRLDSSPVACVVEQLETLKPTHIHFHNILGPWPLIFSSAVKHLSYRPATILTYHSLVNTKMMTLEHRWSHLGNFFDVMVFPSNYNYELFKRLSNIEERKLRLIYNGVPLPVGETAANHVVQKKILYAGRLASDKGVPILLAAWVVLCERFKDFELVIVGDGVQREFLERYVGDLGISRSVRFLGWLDQEELEGELGDAYLLVVPSVVEEPFGLVAAEAAAKGCPVVASDTGGLSEIVEDSVTGFLTPVGDIASLIASCTKLMHDPSLRKQYGEAAANRVQKYFDLGICTKSYIELYEELIINA